MSIALSNVGSVESLYQQGNYAEAAATARALLSVNSGDCRLWTLCGLSSYHLRDFFLAKLALERAGHLLPLAADEQCALAECYARTGQVERARGLYLALADDPDCPTRSLPTISAGLGRLHDHEAALNVCRLASEREPNSPEPLFGMTFYLRRLGYPASVAIPVMNKALDLANGQLLYRVVLAFLLAEDHRNEEAYELICDVRTAEIACPCLLRRMMAVFQAVGDHSRWRRCGMQLGRLRECKSSLSNSIDH